MVLWWWLLVFLQLLFLLLLFANHCQRQPSKKKTSSCTRLPFRCSYAPSRAAKMKIAYIYSQWMDVNMHARFALLLYLDVAVQVVSQSALLMRTCRCNGGCKPVHLLSTLFHCTHVASSSSRGSSLICISLHNDWKTRRKYWKQCNKA